MEEEETDESTPAPADGLQTPSGLDTPSGLTSVVSTVPGGIETPDFLELRKRDSGATVEAAGGAPKQLYHVVPEKQTAVRGLMGSERGYDLGAVGGTAAGVPVLGDERSNKASLLHFTHLSLLTLYLAPRRSGRFYRCCRTRGTHSGPNTCQIRCGLERERGGTRVWEQGGLFRSYLQGECETQSQGRRERKGQGEGVQVLRWRPWVEAGFRRLYRILRVYDSY